jgi:hypothetical protein
MVCLSPGDSSGRTLQNFFKFHDASAQFVLVGLCYEATFPPQEMVNLSPQSWHTVDPRMEGQIHEVVLTEAGYEHQGKTSRSRSPIAGVITGTNWSGPAFFGTKKKVAKQ